MVNKDCKVCKEEYRMSEGKYKPQSRDVGRAGDEREKNMARRFTLTVPSY